MKSEFDEVIDRRNTNSLKWNIAEGKLAMWVADMDFKTAPCVLKTIQQKAAFGVFGYSEIPEAYYESYQEWWRKYHNFDMKKEWMIFSSGVIPALSSMVRKLTTPAEKVLIQSPVYNIFYNSILNNGRVVISSDLHYEHGTYSIDFEDLEQKLQDPQTTMMILCNPHNPIGKVWSKAELATIGALCHKHHVIVVSDEIHCDLTEPGIDYTPFASVDEICAQISITCLSASKAFNLAGLQAACVVVPNEAIRQRVGRGLNTDEVAEPNVFACEATISAFQSGREWLETLKQYISANKKTAHNFIEKHIPDFHIVDSDATYLVWIECKKFYPFIEEFCGFLEEEEGLLISNGSSYGEPGSAFIRINIACPKERLMEGLRRLEAGVRVFSEQYLHSRYKDSSEVYDKDIEIK